MNFKSLIKEQPTTLSLLPTHQCSASCENCCFGCNPNIKHRMTFDEMKFHIDSSLRNFPSIRVLVVSGGECFLIGDDLFQIIEYASSKGLVTRIVSNAFWATSYEIAHSKLLKLKQCGLNEINYSTGDNHQKYVSFQNIINAITAAVDIGFSAVCVAVESHTNSKFNEQDLIENEDLSELIKSKKVIILPGSWMNFLKEKPNIDADNKGKPIYTRGIENRCEKLFQTITINPYSQLLACCGLTVEYNPYLKLGNLRNYKLEDLYNLQFKDALILWLYTFGPQYIYKKICKKNGTPPKRFPHPCAYCIEIIQDKNNKQIIMDLIRAEFPKILFRLEMINKNFY